jgi:hypothetical protein
MVRIPLRVGNFFFQKRKNIKKKDFIFFHQGPRRASPQRGAGKIILPSGHESAPHRVGHEEKCLDGKRGNPRRCAKSQTRSVGREAQNSMEKEGKPKRAYRA